MTTSEMKNKVDLIVNGMWHNEMTVLDSELTKAEVMKALIDKVCELEETVKKNNI